MKRRGFLQLGAGILAASGLSSLPVSAAQSSFGDYKALVHIFLLGGNDGFNMVIPRSDFEYSEYSASRQNLAIPKADILPITSFTNHGAQFGFHPQMSGAQSLFQSGKLAIMGNVGNLVEPLTKQMIESSQGNLPKQLFSHNDQQDQWRYGNPNSIATGWGGRIGDSIYTNNTEELLTSIAIDGRTNWLGASDHLDLSINRRGFDRYSNVRPDRNWTAKRREAFQALMNAEQDTIFGQEFADTQKRTMELVESVGALTNELADFTTLRPDSNRLAEKLEMVGRLIALHEELGMERQVFYVGMGGFDTHDNQNTNQPALLAEVSEAMQYFYSLTKELGVENNITSFTGSDFGRTLTSNGDGTDHAWGSHHLVMGGSVRGGDIQGIMPSLEINGPDDVRNDGRIIPTTSIEQYTDSLISWFGIDESEKSTIFPNRGAFAQNTINLML